MTRRQFMRFIESIDFGEKCWKWQGRTNCGYGVFSIGYKNHYAHRLMYAMRIGTIQEGKVIDHICRNRACVNPNHLEVVTHQVNILRGEGPTANNARKTHCKHGHAFAHDNLWISYNNNGSKRKRWCRTCQRASWKRKQQHK